MAVEGLLGVIAGSRQAGLRKQKQYMCMGHVCDALGMMTIINSENNHGTIMILYVMAMWVYRAIWGFKD